jgi:hypothetical protein
MGDPHGPQTQVTEGAYGKYEVFRRVIFSLYSLMVCMDHQTDFRNHRACITTLHRLCIGACT